MSNEQYGCGGPWGGQLSAGQPPVNISETDTSYTVKLYAPGLDRDRFQVTTQNDLLRIRYRGEADSQTRFTRREYRTEEIERSFDLKGKVNAAGITATYAEGILTIELPKSEAARRPSQQVNVG